MNICVFCSSSNALASAYFNHAKELGRLIANKGHELVYGGANVGLMEHLALAVKNDGGKITGVIPQKIHDRELASLHPDQLIVTASMDERKRKMREIADAFIALPGGFGTLEEILEVITLKQLDYHRKPIVFINTRGFFDLLLKQFDFSYEEKFAKENYRSLYKVVSSPAEAMEYIGNYVEKPIDSKWFKVPNRPKD
ncbi:LOG family protein [Roseimarinus sediminis]|uniref:LOG family protein n=1 Tax=Roseimarinus sediminis TaxID=1610899 RepID=UPI003D1FCBC9